MDKHQRTARIDSVDENGFFRMTLATEGEASDGDILSIKGGRIPARMPLLISHWNDPLAKLGSVTSAVKNLKAAPPQLDATGQIDLGGTGAQADIRRDIAYMSNRHGTAVSIRWDVVEGGKPPIRRVDLASGHPAFVDAETEKNWTKRNGYYWPEWQGLEGSIVALGADAGANAHARASETTGEVSAFWRAMAQHAEGPSEDAKAAASLANLRVETTACLGAGVTPAEIANAIAGADETDDIGEFRRVTIGESQVFLPASIADQLEEERAAREIAPTIAEPTLETDQPPEAPDEELITEEMQGILERLDALEADAAPVLEEERVLDDPLPSLEEERVDDADPLSAPRTLESIERSLAEKSPLIQAKLLRRERKKGFTSIAIARELKAGLDADRRDVIARFREKVDRLRGVVKEN